MNRVRALRCVSLLLGGIACAFIIYLQQRTIAGDEFSPSRLQGAKSHSAPLPARLEHPAGAPIIYRRIPISFEANRGQTDRSVKFLSRGHVYTVFLAPTEVILRSSSVDYEARKKGARSTGSTRGSNEQLGILRMKLIGANPESRCAGLKQIAGKANYFLGNDPSQWRADVPMYERVRVGEVYPGIDLIYYGNQQRLEYDFVISPGADPGLIKLAFEGTGEIRVDPNGDLVLKTLAGEIRQLKPTIYQEVAGNRTPVAGRYVLMPGNIVRFEIDHYDSEKTLTVDPVLSYSTYFGGSDGDFARDIALDASGNIYIAGLVQSTDFPTQNPFQGAHAGGGGFNRSDAFITKLNPAGNALVYSTYLGGSSDDQAYAITVDGSGNAYVTGSTESINFPLANPLQPNRGDSHGDAFVTKLHASGSSLVYSTYLGGNSPDVGNDIAVDGAGNALIGGWTQSSNFPLANAFQGGFGGFRDGFVTKINSGGTAFLFSTFLGGTSDDQVWGVAMGPSGHKYVTGFSNSSNFPTANAFQPTITGGTDSFVTKMNPAGTSLTYSTFLGGDASDLSYGIAVDSSDNVYIAGSTYSVNFPTRNALQPSFGGGFTDAFITKMNAAGSALIFSTYLGGSELEDGNGIAIDNSGNVYVVGNTRSANFPTENAVQPSYGGGFFGDTFVSKVNTAGSKFIYSTFLGGADLDYGFGIRANSAGTAYVAGYTFSSNFPTANAFQSSRQGIGDAFIARIKDTAGQILQIVMSKTIYVSGDTITASEFRFQNQSSSSVAVEVKVWLAIPGLSPITIMNMGADGSFELPGAFNQNLGPITLFTVNSGTALGQYELSSRLLNPITGQLLNEDLNPFEVR